MSATTLAKKIGEDIEQIFKTLVLRGDKTGALLALLPAKKLIKQTKLIDYQLYNHKIKKMPSVFKTIQTDGILLM